MQGLIFGLILALFGGGVSSSWAADCSPRLEAPYSMLVERALDKGVLVLADLQDVLKSDGPVNPLAGAALDSKNSSFHHIFEQYLQMPPERWRDEKVKLARLAGEKGVVQDVVKDARASTRFLLRPVVSDSRTVPLSGVIWAADREGRIFFAGINSANQMEVFDYEKSEPLWRDEKNPVASPPYKFFFGINSQGHFELTLIHERPIPKWNLLRRVNSKMFSRRTVDLVSGMETIDTEYKSYGDLNSWVDPYQKADPHDYNSYVDQQEWSFLSVASPKGGSVVKLKTPNDYEWSRVESYLSDAGQLFLVVDAFQGIGHVLRFFEPLKSAKPLFDFSIAETLGMKISWFEYTGQILAMVETFNGKIYFFDPSSSSSRPIATFDGSRYRSDFFKMFRGPGERIRLMGTREGTAYIIDVYSAGTNEI